MLMLLCSAWLPYRHSVNVLVLGRWPDLASTWLHHVVKVRLRLLHLLKIRRGSLSNTAILIFLLLLLLEMLLLVLLSDELTQLLVPHLDLIQLHLMSIRLGLHLLLFFPCSCNFSCASIDCGLDAEAFLGETLLTCIVEIQRSAICRGSAFHPTRDFDVGQDLPDTDLELLLFCSQLIQLFNQLDVFLENTIVFLCVLPCFLHKLLLQSFHVVLNLRTLRIVLLVNIRSPSVINSLIQHPCAIKTNNSFLELFMRQAWFEKHLLYIISKLPLSVLLSQNFGLHLTGTFGETFLSHSEIIYNQD